MNNHPITEVVLFKLNADANEAAFLQAAEAIMPDLRAMPGFLDRTLLKDEHGQWLDVVHWQSRADALKGAEIFPTLESARPFGAMLDWASVTMLHLAAARVW